MKRPTAAGHRPSFSGYGRRPRRRTARAAARHGFSAWKMSPNSALANTIPTQKMIRTKTGVKFDSASSGPM